VKIATGKCAGYFGPVESNVYPRTRFSPELFYGNGLPVVLSFLMPQAAGNQPSKSSWCWQLCFRGIAQEIRVFQPTSDSKALAGERGGLAIQRGDGAGGTR